MLRQNLKTICSRIDDQVVITGQWDNIHVLTGADISPEQKSALLETVRCTPGISHFYEAHEYPFTTLDDILEKALPIFSSQIAGKMFCLRVKRVGIHDFSSLDVERYIGGGLNQHTDAAGVSVSHPDIIVQLEIRDKIFFLVEYRHEGLGGFPVGSQETTITLMSGGFDSTVAAYLMLKRGIRTHFLFFNMGGQVHEVGVKKVSKYIWDRYGSSHRVRFIAVPFEPLVAEILNKVDNSQMGVVLKRVMFRVAERIADRMDIDTFVTGEAIAQVSSQTMTNLHVIDEVTQKMVLRPLIVADKRAIIDTAREIGTAAFAEKMPEFCGVISRKPTTRAKLAKIVYEESKMDWSILEQALEDAQVWDIDALTDEAVAEVRWTQELRAGDRVIDVRHPDEIDRKPCPVADDALEIPFYAVRKQFSELDADVHYVLYCDRAVMSQMQAQQLQADGFTNVSVWKEGL